MLILFIINVLFCIGYLLLIFWLILQWDNLEETVIEDEHQTKHQFSIIVPFRNEALSIKKCIDSLKSLNFDPRDFEIIAINDHSTDGSEKQIMDCNISVSNATNYGKKNAITEGIAIAKHPFIVTVDADCTFQKDWLRIIDYAICNNKCEVLVGGVKIEEQNGLLNKFQFMDFASTMGITAAGISTNRFYLCNGANFVYRKDLFYKVSGYDGNDTIASGDDVFLINKFVNLPDVKISFLKSDTGTVITEPEVTIKDLYLQRKRWASKTGSYAKPAIIALQGFVFSFSALILLDCLLLSFVFGLSSFVLGLGVLFAKLFIDFFYLRKMVNFYNGNNVISSYFKASFFYLLYIIFMGMTALVPSSVEWKNRKI